MTSTAFVKYSDDLEYDQKSMMSLFEIVEYPPKTSASSDYWHRQIKQRSIDSDGLLESQYFKGLSVEITASFNSTICS